MDVKITPTRNVRILGLDKRSLKNIMWCAFTYRLERVYWIDGYILCLEVYEKAFDYEIKKDFFPISQVCYTEFPNYKKYFEVERGIQIPIVDASEMKLFQEIVKAIKKHEKSEK